MSTTDVTALIGALRDGTLSIDEVAAHFRQRTWRPTMPTIPLTTEERAAQRDPGGDVPGSFDEVTAAYDRGDLTSEQYDVLSEAVADAINAEARRNAAG